MDQFRVSCRKGGLRRHSPLPGPVQATINGRVIASVDARFVGASGSNAAILVSRCPSLDQYEALVFVCATVCTWSQVIGGGLVFADGGREFECEQRLLRSLDGKQLSILEMLRKGLHGYDEAPPGAIVLDPSEPMLAPAVFLDGIHRVDIPVLRSKWFRDVATDLALRGQLPPDTPLDESSRKPTKH